MDIETKAYLINRGLDFLNHEGRLAEKFVLVSLESDADEVWRNLDRTNRRRIETTVEPPCLEDVDNSTKSQQQLLGTFVRRVSEIQPNFVLSTDFSTLPTRKLRETYREQVVTHFPRTTNMLVVGSHAPQIERNLWLGHFPVRSLYVPGTPDANQVTIVPRQSMMHADPVRPVLAELNFCRSA